MITKEMVVKFFEERYGDKDFQGESMEMKDDFAILTYTHLKNMKILHTFMVIRLIDNECKDMMLQGTHFLYEFDDEDFNKCMERVKTDIDHFIKHGWWKIEEKYWGEN